MLFRKKLRTLIALIVSSCRKVMGKIRSRFVFNQVKGFTSNHKSQAKEVQSNFIHKKVISLFTYLG
jgi:hypothetical protein